MPARPQEEQSPGPGWGCGQRQRLDHFSLTSLHERVPTPQETTPFSRIGMPRLWTYLETEDCEARPRLNCCWVLDMATPGEGIIARNSRAQRLPSAEEDHTRRRECKETERGFDGRGVGRAWQTEGGAGDGCMSDHRWTRCRYSYLVRRRPSMMSNWSSMTGLMARCRRLVAWSSLGISAGERMLANASGMSSSTAERGDGSPRME